jgi:hypothetical protein
MSEIGMLSDFLSLGLSSQGKLLGLCRLQGDGRKVKVAVEMLSLR